MTGPIHPLDADRARIWLAIGRSDRVVLTREVSRRPPSMPTVGYARSISALRWRHSAVALPIQVEAALVLARLHERRSLARDVAGSTMRQTGNRQFGM